MPRNIVPAFEYIGFSAYFVFCVFFFPFPFCFSSYSVSSICWHSYYVPFIEQSRRHKPLLSGVIMPAIRKHKMYAHVHISPDVDEVCSWPQQYFDFHFNRFANNSMTSTATGNCSPVQCKLDEKPKCVQTNPRMRWQKKTNETCANTCKCANIAIVLATCTGLAVGR